MDRMDVELIGIGILFVTSLVWMLLLLLRDKGLDRKESNLDDRLKNWADKYAELKSEYLQVDAERAEWKRQYEIAREDVMHIQKQFHQKVQELEEMEEKLDQSEKAREWSLNERDKLADRLNESLEYRQRMGKTIKDLQSQLAEANDANRVIVDAQVQVAENYERRVAECQREIEAKEALYQAERETNRRLEGFIETYEREVLQLKTDKEHLAKAINLITEQAERLQRETEDLEQANEILNAADTRDERIKELEQQVMRLQEELAACDRACKQCGKDRDELLLERSAVRDAARKERFHELDQEIQRLQGELSACNNQNREFSVSADKLKELDDLKCSVFQLTEEVRAKTVETDRLKESVTLWQHRCAERDEQARQREERLAFEADPGKDNTSLLLINGLQAELSSHREANNSLKNQLEDLGEKYDATVAENDRLKSHGRELLESLDNTAAERDHNWQTMKQMEKERNELKLKCDKLKQENTRLIVDYGKAEHVTTDFRLDIDTQAFKDSLDLTVRRCEELKRAIVEANGGKTHEKRPMPKPNTINAMGPNDPPVTVQEVVDGISAGIDWGSIKPLPVRSLDLEEIDSTVDGDGDSVGE